ncbi:Ig-like domain-containing protein [Paenibacillus sp. SC116]|nr:Ig-like domain-containing protein [Paenibacillus sp. SC116]
MLLILVLVLQLVPVENMFREVQASGGMTTYTMKPVAAGFQDNSGYYPNGDGGLHYAGYEVDPALGKSVGALRFDLNGVTGKVIEAKLRLYVQEIQAHGGPVYVDLKVASDDQWITDLPQKYAPHAWTTIYREGNFPASVIYNQPVEFVNSAAIVPYVQNEINDNKVISFVLDGNSSITPGYPYNGNSFMAYSMAELIIITEPIVNKAPIAGDANIILFEDRVAGGMLSGTDPDGNPLTYSIVTPPNKGTVTITNAFTGTYTYTPYPNASGNDSFTFKGNDGSLDSVPATVSVTINQVNDAPVAIPGTLSVVGGAPTNGTVTGSDIEGDILTFSLITAPSKGTVVLNANGAYTYTPILNATGTDSFMFKVNDGVLVSAPATVRITLTPTANTVPLAAASTISTVKNTAVGGTLLGTDADGDTLAYSIVQQPSKGKISSLDTATGTYTYTPNNNVTGSDTFTFQVNDGTSNSAPAAISVVIAPINDAPVSADSTLSVTEDTYEDGRLTAVDVDGDALRYSIVTSPAKGTITIIDPATGAYKFTPNQNVTGTDSFTFKVNDGVVDSNTATVSVTIAEVNDAPIVSEVMITGIAQVGKVLTGTYTYADVEGDREGASKYRWYAVDADGNHKVVIPNATGTTVTLTSAQQGKYITFEVVPTASLGMLEGTAVESAATSMVAATPSVPNVYIPVTNSASVIDKNGDIIYPENIDTTKPSITLEVAPKNGGTYVTIPAGILKRFEQKNNRFLIEIKAPYGSYHVPANLASLIPNLQDLLKINNLKEEDVSFKIVINEISLDKAIQAALYEKIPNSTILGLPVDFSMQIINHHTGKIVGNADQLSQSTTRLIPMPKDMSSLPAHWGVFRYTEATKKFEFVPAKQLQIDGVWYAMINSYSNRVHVAVENAISYSDMKQHWAKSYVQTAAAKGLVDGVGSSKYNPEKAVTRAEFTAMVVRALGRGVAIESSKVLYNDVKPDAWYFNTVTIAQEYGLLKFAKGDSFMPNKPITREEMASMLSAVISVEKLPMTMEYVSLEGFKDIGNVNAAYLEDVRTMVKLKIMSGQDKATILPKGETTRAQAAVVLVKTLQALGSID